MKCYVLMCLCIATSFFYSCRSTDSAVQKLEIFNSNYPRAFFFRKAESCAASGKYSYDEWEKIFSRLYGIEGKVLTEEVSDRGVYNLDYFNRFKEEHPRQIVLLHFNGNARDPRYEREKYFAGHWAYYQGCKNLTAIPADSGVMKIKVEDARLFRSNLGRFNDACEDIGICMLDSANCQNWRISEQVELVSADTIDHFITVRRGCYGTSPLSFPAGKAWLAAHIHEGPWKEGDHLLWYYNHSTRCPKDANGQQCDEILSSEIASLFNKGGILSNFDGLELDVLMSSVTAAYPLGNRQADLDCDGLPDNGIFNGINSYSEGVVKFSKSLRQKLNPDKLYLADSFRPTHQRAFNTMNGIETEGWPALYDPEFKWWSEGINRLLFWRKNSLEPKFGYINHKWGGRFADKVTVSRNRLVMAVSVLTDYAICYCVAPECESGEEYGIWDELKMGAANRKGWLGKPVSATNRMALGANDILKGNGIQLSEHFLKNVSSRNGDIIKDDMGLKITAKNNIKVKDHQLELIIPDIPVNGPDLFISFKIKGQKLAAYPENVGRLLYAGLEENNSSKRTNPEFVSWFNKDWFKAGIYFRNVKAKTVNLVLEFEGGEPVWIDEISMHAHPDVMAREFENGIVLANPSLHDYTFNLAELFPREQFKRLTASSKQDTIVNNGQAVGNSITVGERDAIFLIKINTEQKVKQ